MIVQCVEALVSDGRQTEFEAALCEVRQRVFMSAGYRGFTVAQGMEASSRYLILVLWETAEELVDFMASRFERAWSPVQPFLVGPLRADPFEERPSLTMRNEPGVITDFAWLTD